MIGQKTVTVGGTDYMITHLPASRGVRVLKALGKLLGPALPSYKESGITGAIASLVGNIDNVDVENLLKELMGSVTKNNMAVNFDLEFAGAYDKLFALTQEVVEFNFGSVFTLLGSEESPL